MNSFVTRFVTHCFVALSLFASTASAQKQWTVMIYMGADNDLEGAAIEDINEMEVVGSSSQVNIVVQIDRHPGYDASNGNWTSTRRYYITQDFNTSTISSTLTSDLGEQNSGSASTLNSFVSWAMSNYPAQKYYLIIWDHGSGWQKSSTSNLGIQSIVVEEPRQPDMLTFGRGKSTITPEDCYRSRFGGDADTKYSCVDETNNDRLYNDEVQQVLATQPTLSILGFDACLMAMVEVAYEFRDEADYLIASEEVEPEDGWPYDLILSQLTSQPSMSAAALCTVVVDSYATDMALNSTNTQTLSAIRLSGMDQLRVDIDQLTSTIEANGVWAEITHYSTEAQQFGGNSPQPYRDLMDLAIIASTDFSGAGINSAANVLVASLQNTIIRNFAESGRPGAYGLSIYLPTSYISYDLSYELGPIDFPDESQWTSFLRYYWWGPTVTVFDMPEPNDVPSQCGFPMDTAYTYQSYLPDDLDRDWWLIHSGIAETLTVDLGVPANADFDILLYDVTGTSLLAISEAAGNGVPEKIKFYSPTPANFFLEVVPFLSSSLSPYSLSISQRGHRTGSFQLSYDDNSPDGSYYSPYEGDVIGVFWDLPSYPMRIDRIWINFSTLDAAGTGGDGSFWLLFFDNYGYLLDPIELGPLQPAGIGWNYLELTGLNIVANTAVFAGVLYDGVNTPAVGYDQIGRGKDYYMPASGTEIVPLDEGLFFRLDLTYPPVALSAEEEHDIVPSLFSVAQNYPNPFNSSTTIQFSTQSQLDISIEVINILGQSVWTKGLGVLPAGEHTVEWNGTASGGESVCSGVYFVRVSSGLQEYSKKMILLK